jgi:hypothetical protein
VDGEKTNPNEPKSRKAKDERKLNCDKALRRYLPLWRPEKQTQFKPNSPEAQNERNYLSDRQLPRSSPQAPSAKQTQTNPISKGSFGAFTSYQRNPVFVGILRRIRTAPSSGPIRTQSQRQLESPTINSQHR